MTLSAGPLPQPTIGALRVVAGRRVEDTAPCAAALEPSLQAARGREEERLFVLLDLTGPVAPHLYRELREVITQTYWSSTGSITAALRRAAAAANRRLFQSNLHHLPPDRNHGGLVCAVLHDQDLFIARAGSTHACLSHTEHLEHFSDDKSLTPLGTGQVTNVRLHHAFAVPGDVLLLSSSALLQEAGDEGLRRALTFDRVADVLDGLEQVGGEASFSAMVVRWPMPGEVEDSQIVQPTVAPQQEAVLGPSVPLIPSIKDRVSNLLSRFHRPAPPPVESRPEQEEAAAAQAVDWDVVEATVETYEEDLLFQPVPSPPVPPPSPVSEWDEPETEVVEYTPYRPEVRLSESELVEPEPGPGLGERLGDGVSAMGRGFAAAAGAVGSGARTLARHILPGSEQEVHRSARAVGAPAPRSIPEENRPAMMALAIGIPILLAIAVVAAYLTFGTTSRLQNLVSQAEQEVVLAQTVGSSSDASRGHWEAALVHADQALALKSDDQVAAALKAQAETALDLLDSIIRLQPVLLKDVGSGPVARRLAVHGTRVFVLDPAGGWVSELTTEQGETGMADPQDIPILFKTNDFIGEGRVGRLVDLVWMDGVGGRQNSGLVILEEDGGLVTYDPSWGSMSRSFLGVPPEQPTVIDTYEGRLYVLDAALNQIRRYKPYGDTYPDRPENYFVTPPAALAGARDMAIDGRIYVLYNDGTIAKFLGGDPEPFNVQNVPGGLGRPVALAVDPHGSSGVVYLADQGEAGMGRVVALGSDGAFWAQFRADEVFTALETLAVNEASRRLYVISAGKLYAASLPLP
ncbi:MAG TPA: hypothetical protein ENN99_05135 [Chloroflexi bacterium]|nr:hypothetical protein [Chloroflexota bacterium]